MRGQEQCGTMRGNNAGTGTIRVQFTGRSLMFSVTFSKADPDLRPPKQHSPTASASPTAILGLSFGGRLNSHDSLT
jgi:hypothetical protein